MTIRELIESKHYIKETVFEQILSNYELDLTEIKDAGDDLQCMWCTRYSDEVQPFYKLTIKHRNVLNEIYIYFLCGECTDND